MAVAVPSFTGLRASSCSAKPRVSVATPSAKVPAGSIKAASFKDLGVVVVAATAASAMLVGDLKVSAGENNAGVVLKEGEVDVAKISMREEEYLNIGGETYLMRLNGSFDCAPHQGPHMEEDAKQMQRKLVARLMKPW